MGKNATLTYDGKSYELPVMVGTEDETAVDISALRAKSGLITLDSGYANTGACTSNITFIDGEKGILRYRGLPSRARGALEASSRRPTS
jgi:citrate synthase